MSRLTFAAAWSLVAILSATPAPALAEVKHTAVGVSAKDVPVEFEASLSIVGDLLTVTLSNNSPVDSLNPDDVLGSYYFDIVDAGSNRPTLTYFSGVGDVYMGDKDAADLLQEAALDLTAFNPGDDSWQFKSLNTAFTPFLGFGLGTVGNSNLAPNNFNGNIVDGIDYSIFKGEITTTNLHEKLLVKESATFTFTGVAGFTEADISPDFAFGLGTAPDSLLVPEPASVLLLACGAVCLRRRRHTR